ncbi:hypothetical protein GMORB2_2547 [Geosmithia morbida]|uniref:Uncharacterized protein n=1 Tax=Geosmithia morbida TaxID=1094350 RepID=A0A9P4YSX2_9HYPO|nr:uncharacterized protein GMORB2_2547 [Geosmithia morbida]KAF4121061.1 hypothetical protein GMORB2_2547 [Geosmithia morbida]
MSTSSTNSWLRGQRKSDLVEIAENVGLQSYENLKKAELEVALDEYLAEHTTRFSSRSELFGYYNSRSKALGSPVKKEGAVKDEAEKAVKVARRKASKAAEEIANETEVISRTPSSALVQTPGRSFSQVASRLTLPATPADVAHAVDRSTLAVRQRVSSLYTQSGITDVATATRDSLSTIHSIVLLVSAFELLFVRAEVLPSRYAFTVPAVPAIGTSDYPVYLPDMFLLLTSSFWYPALTWALTSLVLPSLFGYFFNLSATSSVNASAPRTRARAAAVPDYAVDPLTFSVAKALLSFVVYGQKATLGGLLPVSSITRLDRAVYGGYKGILTGTAVTGLASIYDAVLRK